MLYSKGVAISYNNLYPKYFGYNSNWVVYPNYFIPTSPRLHDLQNGIKIFEFFNS